MNQELQFLINTLYGNKLNEKQLSGILQMAQSNPQYLDNMRNAAKAKMPAGNMVMNPVAQQKVMNEAGISTPKIGASNFQFDKNAGKAKNDMSAVDDFKQAFRTARQGGNKTFFWKKTKANPSGMFNTEVAKTSYQLPEDNTNDELNVQVFPVAIDQTKINKASWEKDLYEPYPNKVVSSGSSLVDQINTMLRKNTIPNPMGNPGQRVQLGQNQFLQQGGAVQNIEQQVTQLVQAAAGGDQKATQQIEQIMQAAQQGDQQAVQIAQIIQKVITTMQQQKGIKAKLGAKLDYLRKIKGLCPDGEELVYMKQGGRVCPVCQKKAEKAKDGKKLPKQNAVSKFKEDRKKINPNDTVNTKFGPRDLNGNTKYKKYDANKENYDFKTRMRVQEKDEKSGKKVIGSACGSKMKKK